MEFKLKEEILKQFYEKSFPVLVSFEQERKRRLCKMLIIESILVAICALYFCNIVAIESFISHGWFVASQYAIFTCALVVFAYPHHVTSEFNEDLKIDVIPEIMKTFKTIMHSTNNDIISEKELRESILFSNFSRMESDDSFCGMFNGVNCRILETELTLRTRKSYIPCFKGVIISFKSNKKINAKTIVMTKNDNAVGNGIPPRSKESLISLVILGSLLYITEPGAPRVLATTTYLIGVIIILIIYYIVNKREGISYNLKMKQIKLEDTKFAKKFRVFSEDEIEGRYLITPSFIERFLNCTTSLSSNKAKCAFFDDKVMFAISTRKNLFEFGSLFKPMGDPKSIGFFNEIFSILDMIDYFKHEE